MDERVQHDDGAAHTDGAARESGNAAPESDDATHAPLHAVVLAGGSGTRFWPLSRELSPKQLLSVFGGVSLITRAVRRVQPFVDLEGVHVVTGERLFDELRNHLAAQAELDDLAIDYMVEPSARNTAPALALAAAAISQREPDAVLIMLPSDHLLEEGEVWARTIRAARRLAEKGDLVTIGLVPTAPETGYGYIRAGEVVLPDNAIHGEGRAVVEFVEKPDDALAERFVASGEYLWNSGMLVAKASTILEELRRAGAAAATPESAHGAAIADAAEKLAAIDRSEWTGDAARELYNSLPAAPFDKAALEVSQNVSVIPTSLEWSDVGSLLSIHRLGEPDERGNILIGRSYDVDSTDALVYSAGRLVATLGLNDVLVVDTDDATLVADKSRAQDVRKVVEVLRAAGAPEVVESRHSVRPWGSWTLLMKGDGFQIKSIDLKPGARLSLQSHEQRSEHWVVVEGSACVTRNRDTIHLEANQSIYLEAGAVHRLENCGDVPLKVVEVAVGVYLGEDDIVRYDDDFGRGESE